MDAELIRQYTLIVDFLGHVLGPDYEIALHELEDDSNRIIAIANGELTGRHIGSPLSNKMLEFVAGDVYKRQDEYCSTADILRTLLNLFGVDYDSRLLAGTDVLSNGVHIAVLSDKSFLTKTFRYDAGTETVILSLIHI